MAKKMYEDEMDSATGDYSSPDDSQFLEAIGVDEKEDDSQEVSEFGLSKEEEAKLIKRASKASKEAHSYWDSIYDLMEDDWDMYSGLSQWTEEASNARRNRPKLTLNHLPKFVKRIVAETKKNPPGAKLAPREAGDKLKADIGSGVVRYIEDCSGAKYAYSHALECAVIGGLGWYKGTFDDKKIILKKVKDPFYFQMDPDAEEVDGSDAKYFIAHTKKKDGKKVIDCFEYWFKDEDEVKWAIIEGNTIKDYGIFPGQIIPIFPVFGEDMSFRDERIVKGIIRDMTDAQRTYNYIKSQEVETVALTPKSPVIAMEGQLEGFEDDWRKASKSPVDILYYKKPKQGEQSVPPSFGGAKPDTTWAAGITSGAQQDLREISGIYDTNLGSDDRAMSGKAIIAKQDAGDASQYTYTEHLMATIQWSTKWILGMIKPVLGDKQVLTILGEDGKQSVIDTRTPQVDPVTGQPVMLDLDFGEMDISVSSGPAYATRREAGANAMQEIMVAIPNSANLIADLAVRNLDVPGAEEAADRLKRALPPEIRDPQPEQAGMVPQAMVDQIMGQSEQTIQQQQEVINKMAQQLQSLQLELQNQTNVELSKQQINSSTQIAVAQIKESGADGRKMAEIQAKAESDNKKIIADAQKTNQKMALDAQKIVADASKPVPQAVPNTVSISNTTVNPEPVQPAPLQPLVMKAPFNIM
jgi:hypothetical protein